MYFEKAGTSMKSHLSPGPTVATVDRECSTNDRECKNWKIRGDSRWFAMIHLPPYESTRMQWDSSTNAVRFQHELTRTQYDSTRLQYESARMQYESTRMQYESPRMQYESARMQYDCTRMQYDSTRMQW